MTCTNLVIFEGSFYQIYYVLAFWKYNVHAVNIFPVEELSCWEFQVKNDDLCVQF